MLAASGDVTYITEPLNPEWPGILRIPIQHWFQYVCVDNEQDFLAPFQESARLETHALRELRHSRNAADLLRVARWTARSLQGRLRGSRALFKDPFAVFSVDWFAERIDCDVVAVIRHPLPVIGSLKRLDWEFDLGDLLSQGLLMRDRLEAYREEMERLDRTDMIATQSLLWMLVYTALTGAPTESRTVFVWHEELSSNPIEGFQSLYERLGLEFTDRARRTIEAATSASNPTELTTAKRHDVRLNSRRNLGNWRSRLSPQEIGLISEMTRPLVDQLYPDGI
jgi:hypothetical protein